MQTHWVLPEERAHTCGRCAGSLVAVAPRPLEPWRLRELTFLEDELMFIKCEPSQSVLIL